MKRFILIPTFALLAGCLPESQSKQIAVNGEAEIEVIPDSFRMSAVIRSRAGGKDSAIQEISSTLNRITVQLPDLEGLGSVTVEPSNVEIQPVYDRECAESRYDDETCPVAGQFAEIFVDIEGAPADVAGNAFSLLSELGADEVEFDEYFLSDPASAEREAEKQAFDNARQKAQRLAAAANVTLLLPIRISSNQGRDAFYYDAEEDTVIVTGSRVQPKNILSITPPPITIQREVSVIFEIE